MKQTIQEHLCGTIAPFHLPRYDDIPNVGLYLEQTVSYLADYLRPLSDTPITGSMISNYVKKKLVSNPVRKQYNREQIAALVFIAITKSVLSLDNIATLLTICKKKYDLPSAYNLFCDLLEDEIIHVFGTAGEQQLLPLGDGPSAAETSLQGEEQAILCNTIIAVAHKTYLDQWIALYSQSECMVDQGETVE